MKLIIAEKPCFAKFIIDRNDPGGFTKKEEYFINKEYIITWSYSHLFKLDSLKGGTQIESPSEFFKTAAMSDGFCPDCFNYILNTQHPRCRQFEAIKVLIHRDDIDEVIHAGDFNGDGEIIIREILHMAGCNVPVKRLWHDFSSPLIFAPIHNAGALSVHDKLAREGFCNAYQNMISGNNHPCFGLSPENQFPFIFSSIDDPQSD